MSNNLIVRIYTGLICFIAIFLCCIKVSMAEFVSSYSVNSPTIKKIEEWIDHNTIVFIEIDNTIMMPVANMFSFDSNQNRQFIENLVSLGKKTPVYNIAVANWYQQRKVKLVEDGWVDFINRIKNKRAVVYGICSMPLRLEKIEEKRYYELQQLAINFTNLIDGKEQILIKKKDRWAAQFYKGIIFTGPYSKAYTLVEFMSVIGKVPSKMIIIGNIKHEIKAIDAKLRVFNMQYYSIYYLGARNVLGKPDSDIIQLQERELIRNGKWLEDKEAANVLKSLK